MLLEEIGYVIETVSIFGRTTADVHALVNCYAPTIIQTYDTPSFPDKQSGFGRFCFAYTTIYPLVIAMRSAFLNDKSSSLFITLSLPTAKLHQQFVQKTLFIYRE